MLVKKSSFTTGKPSSKYHGGFWPESYVRFLEEYGSGVMSVVDFPDKVPSTEVRTNQFLVIFSPFEEVARYNLHYITSVEAAEVATLSNFSREVATIGFWEGDLIPIGSFESGLLICLRILEGGKEQKEWTISLFEAPYEVEHLSLTFGEFINSVLKGNLESELFEEEYRNDITFFWYPFYLPEESSDVEPTSQIEVDWSESVEPPSKEMLDTIFGDSRE